MQTKWQMRLWATMEFLLFVTLFSWTNLFIACVALVGCLLVQWIAMSTPSNEKTQVLMGGTVFTTVSLSVCGLYYINQVGEKITWPQWYVFGQSSKAATLAKEKSKAEEKEDGEWNALFLKSLNQVAENTGRIAAGQDEIKKAVEDARLEAEERFYSKKGREDAKRDFENGDTSKAKPIPETERILPQIVLPEDIPGEAIPQTPVPKKAEPKKPAKPTEPEVEQGPPKGLRLPTDKDDMPQGTPIPNTSPKEPTPELRAKIAPPEKRKDRPKFVICSCENCKEKEHKHEITGWFDFDRNGEVEPIYLPCFYRETGMAACRFKEFAWE